MNCTAVQEILTEIAANNGSRLSSTNSWHQLYLLPYSTPDYTMLIVIYRNNNLQSMEDNGIRNFFAENTESIHHVSLLSILSTLS
jgi:serine protease inhibitor